MINIEEFLLPITPDNECGEYLRYDSVYDQIQECCREDDPRLTQGIWKIDLKQANWSEALKLCTSVLQTRSKDLQISMWMTEALIALNGFSGFCDGIKLLLALSNKFWKNIHPHMNGSDMTYRMSPFFYLTEKITDRLLLIALTQPQESLTPAYSLSDWITSRYNLKLKIRSGVSFKQLNKSIAATPRSFFENTLATISELTDVTHQLDDFLTNISANDAPSFKQMYDYLGQIKHILLAAVPAEETPSSPPPQSSSEVQSEAKTEIKETPATDEPTIEQAYTALQDIANFLEKKQPQSPAAILVKIAATIGDKSFQELLDINLKKDVSVMQTISELYKALSQIQPIDKIQTKG